MQKKVEFNKHMLTIQIPLSQQKNKSPNDQFDNLYVRPVYSVKNKNKTWTKITFDEQQLQSLAKSRKEKRLQKDNQLLLSSLVALKTGAVSAIAQKQEEIEKLRSGVDWQQEIKAIQQQVQDLYHQRRQLKEQIQYLAQRLQTQKQSFSRMLQQKQRVLQELYSQLSSTQMNIQNLQKILEVKDRKLKIIEEQNAQLFHQLSQFQLQRISYIGHQSTQNTQNNDSDYSRQLAPIQQDSCQNFFSSKQNINTSNLQIQKITQLQLKHKQQLQQLSHFYEKRITEMREIYDRQLFAAPIQHKYNYISAHHIEQQGAYSYKGTQVDPKKLSYQLINFPKIGQCFSVTKKNLSQADRFSIFTADKEQVTSRNNIESNQNAQIKAKVGSQPSTNQRQQKGCSQCFGISKTQNQCECLVQSKSKFNLGSFILGATAGGAVATLMCKWINF